MDGEVREVQIISRYRLEPGPRLIAWGSYRLFGVCFGLVGVVLGSVPLAATLNGWWRDPFWVLTVLSLLLVATGWLVSGFRERLEVADDTLIHNSRTRFANAERCAEVAALRAVRLSTRVSGSPGRRRVQYVVELVVDHESFPQPLRVFAASSERAARAAAEELSRALDRPFEDALGDEIVRREVRELDTFTRPQAGAGGPVPACVSVGHHGGATVVRIRGVLRARGVAIGAAAGVLMSLNGIAAGLLVYRFSGASLLPAVAVVSMLMLPGLLFLLWAVVGRYGYETLSLSAGRVTREASFAGLRYSRRSMAVGEVENLRVQSRGAAGYGLAVSGDRECLLVGRALDKDGLEWLRSWLGERL